MNELVRLNDVIETVRGFVKYIEELPRAGDENYVWDEWCTDCKEYDHEKHCCPRFNRVIHEAVEEIKEAHQAKSRNMRVVDRLDELQEELERFKEEYCDGCQEFTCDECRRGLTDEGWDEDE